MLKRRRGVKIRMKGVDMWQTDCFIMQYRSVKNLSIWDRNLEVSDQTWKICLLVWKLENFPKFYSDLFLNLKFQGRPPLRACTENLSAEISTNFPCARRVEVGLQFDKLPAMNYHTWSQYVWRRKSRFTVFTSTSKKARSAEDEFGELYTRRKQHNLPENGGYESHTNILRRQHSCMPSITLFFPNLVAPNEPC